MSYKGKLSQYPREATVQVIDDEKCLGVETLGTHFGEDTLAMFCAYNIGTDACQVSPYVSLYLAKNINLIEHYVVIS